MSDSNRAPEVCNPNQATSQALTNVPPQPSLENSDQDTASFYGSLFDQGGYPSEKLCRMTDSLFFYVDYNCVQYRGTNAMEPEKMAWELAALGQDAKACELLKKELLPAYDSFGIPYTLNKSGGPVLDRRGYLHLRVFEALASPEEGHQDWNQYLDVFKLRDPQTGVPFPTPIPRSAFPAYPDYGRRSIYISWQTQLMARLQETNKVPPSSSAPQPSRSTPRVESASEESQTGWKVADAVVEVSGAALEALINGMFS